MTELTTDRTPEIEGYRSELTAYCYRMLGSPFEAEEAAQDALVRAWRALDRFEGRAALRSWLYRIATNVCYDMLNGRRRRALPVDLVPESTAASAPGAPLPDGTWVEPIPDGRVLPATSDPAEATAARETIRLAFVAALQHLPPRQRAVLILRDVLRWRSSEVAELLETSVASVNSALQRARATLQDRDVAADPAGPTGEEQRQLLARYVDAFERYDVEALVALLHEDATMSMPPMPLWLRGPGSIADWWKGPGLGCRGSRVVPVAANGMPALAQYRPADSGSGYEPFAIHLLTMSADRITDITAYIDAGTGLRFDRSPALPQSITLLARDRERSHRARLLTRQADDGIRVRLEVEPPRRMALVPAVHREHDEVRAVLDVADDDVAFPPGPPSDGREAQRSPAALVRRGPQEAAAAELVERSMDAPRDVHEPRRRDSRRSGCLGAHGRFLPGLAPAPP